MNTKTLKNLPKQGDLYNPMCPSRKIIDQISGLWGSIIVKALHENGVLRFTELRNTVGGISDKVLSQTLRNLERNGVVQRKSYPVIPPKVEYSLTPLGKRCAVQLQEFCTFIEDNMYGMVLNQMRYDKSPTKTDWQISKF